MLERRAHLQKVLQTPIVSQNQEDEMNIDETAKLKK